ncbi:MAG: hypothetical protein HYX51_01440 [Chloroflexi bacterium]|nr:hypothetical protein [Chloroflexota bacterium]
MIGVREAWLIPVIPLGAFVIIAFFHNYLPRKGDFIGVLAILTSFVLTFVVLYDAIDGYPAKLPGLNGYEWLQAGRFNIEIGFFVDEIALVMLVVVTTVALMVNIYSMGYMQERHSLTPEEQRRLLPAGAAAGHGGGHDAHGSGHDPHAGGHSEDIESSTHHEAPAAVKEPRYGWFFAALSLFAFSMLTLVLADNLLLLYAAWELVGICSFLLIGFYWERRSAAEAAKKAFVTTRIGDVGMLIGIILLWKATGTFNIREILEFAEQGRIGQTYLVVASLCLFLGPMGKSAQMPFHVWLPDAMEGPTPVSALIHAATMVVAGIYLVARMLPLFQAADVEIVILVVGMVTAIFAAIVALAQTDLKKVIAYSTLSNLGIMMVALGLGSVTAAMGRVFLGEPRDRTIYDHAHESPFSMTFPLLVLGALSLVAGFVIIPGVAESIGLPDGFGALVYTTFERPEEWRWSTGLAVAGTVSALLGFFLAGFLLAVPGRMARFTAAIPELYGLTKNKFYFDEMYQWLIDRVVLVMAYGIAWFDRHLINDTGVDGTSSLTSYFGFRLKFAQTGKLPNYALAIVIGVLTLVVVAFTTRT